MAPYLFRVAGLRKGLADSRRAVDVHAAWWNDHNRTVIDRHSTVPDRHSTVPDRHSTDPDRHSTDPDRHSTDPDRHSTVTARAASGGPDGRTGGWMLALGDSAAQGVGASHPSLSWVGQLASVGGQTDRVVNLSVSGARVADLVDVQLPQAEALFERLGPPETTVIHIGGNDLFRPGNPLSFGRGLAALGGWLAPRETGAATVLGLMPRTALGLTAAEANWRLRKTARSADALTADINTHAHGSVGSRVANDMFHPNDAGYAAWAGGFADALGYSTSGPVEQWGAPLGDAPLVSNSL